MKDFSLSLASYNNYKFQHKKWLEEKNVEKKALNMMDDLVNNNSALKELVENQHMVIVSVEIELKNGMILSNCSIYRPEPNFGYESIQSIIEIDRMFNRTTTYYGNDYIYFQNELIQGKVHISNVKNHKVNVIEF